MKGSPILDQVLEVAERGRSLGIVLFGAQQFLSAVHDRVTGNCSTTLLGRTNAAEMAERNYRFLNPDIKVRHAAGIGSAHSQPCRLPRAGEGQVSDGRLSAVAVTWSVTGRTRPTSCQRH